MNSQSSSVSLSAVMALLLATALIAGCGKNNDARKGAAKEKTPTQVAARVNTQEITVHQVNNVLARNPKIPPEAAAQAKYEILNRLIDLQLAKQQAIEQKLDRKPNVLQAIEAARSEILARAYLDQVAAAQPRPTPDEVKRYYAEHPELFAERRIFNLEEIVVAPQEGLAAKLSAQAAKARSLQDIADWLRDQNIQFAPNRGIRPAEALPLELLPKLQTMKDGEIRVIESNGRLYVFRVAGSKSAPVDEKTATPRIQQFLFNRQSSEVVATEMARLKAAANIEYFGEFTGDAAAAAANAKTGVEAKAKVEVKAQADTDAQSAKLSKTRSEAEERSRREADGKASLSEPEQIPQKSIDKGIRAFK